MAQEFNPTRVRHFDNGLSASYDDEVGIKLNREVNTDDLVKLGEEIKDLINAFVGVAEQRAQQANQRPDARLSADEIKAISRFTNGLGPMQQELIKSLNRAGITQRDVKLMGFDRK